MDRDEQKTPPKESKKEISPNCHTPDKGTDCHTPTNPSPERKDAFHTPSTHLSPEKGLDDDGTPTRVLRSKSGRNDVQVVESRELRSSPRTPNALKEKSSSGKELGTSKRNKAKKGSSSENTSDGGSERQRTHVKTRSTSSSPAAACSVRGKGTSCAQEELINHSSGGTRSIRGQKSPPVHGKEVSVEESRESVRKGRSQEDSSDESSSKENNDLELVVEVQESETANAEGHVRRPNVRSGTTRGSDPELVVDARGSETADGEGHVTRSKVRSGTTRGGQEPRANVGAKREDRVESQSGVEEESEHELAKGSPRRASLRSVSKPSPARDVKNAETPKTEGGTRLERKMRSRTQSSPTTAKQSSEKSTNVSEKKASEVSSNDQVTMETESVENVTRLTRSRIQTSPAPTAQACDNVGHTTASDASSPVTLESTEEVEHESQVQKRRASLRRGSAKCEMDTSPSQENEEAVRDETTSQSSRSFSCDVEVKLSDCRRICVDLKRPALERESDDSETESIQLSSGENVAPPKEASSHKTSSEVEDEEISSTPTLSHCPSSPSSVKSGYSNERPSYSLRKRVEQQEEEASVRRRTRSNYRIPDEESAKDSRRKTVTSPFTSVKPKSPKQRCQSVKNQTNDTPERKIRKNTRGGKSPLTSNTTPRRKAPRLKDPASESDSSSFSGSPRSGPIRETRSMRALTSAAVRSLEKADLDSISVPLGAKDNSTLSQSTVSLGDVSTTAICGTPRHRFSVDFNLVDDFPGRKEKYLRETKLSNDQKFQSSHFLGKDRQTNGVDRLFDSDDENEDFYGFNVPQFDRSNSSEGDLSFKINSIVESIDCGETSQDTVDDVENTTLEEIQEDENEDESVQEKAKPTTGERKITKNEQMEGKMSEKCKETKQTEAVRNTRKRKSGCDIESVAAETKRAKSECQDEGRRFSVSYTIDSWGYDRYSDVDVYEDDDVFSTVSGSTDGEEEEVGSPFSVTSWRQKRKSEDLESEVDRPSKRRKSHEQWGEQMATDTSSQSTKSGTPLKSRANRRIIERSGNREALPSTTSKLDKILSESQRIRVPSFSSVEGSSEFYYSDEPVVQTLEERVKLRRKRKMSQKAHENLSSSALSQDSNVQESGKETSSATKREILRKSVLPLQPLKHVSPNPAESKKTILPLKPLKHVSTSRSSSKKVLLPLKPLQHVSPIRASARLNRVNSSPSFTQSPLATPSGKPRRPTWIYDVSEFASPPSEAPGFGGKRITCSTPMPLKHSLRSQRSDKMTSRKSRQRDAFAFDEE